ncbi:methionyl-tRNA synthetase, partial [Reticulomyxa filosa]
MLSCRIKWNVAFSSSIKLGHWSGGSICSNVFHSRRHVSDEERQDKKFFLTTAINYTNGNPHVGHAYEALVSDIIARYHRIYGREVFFLTGTDEHGQKIAQKATSEGLTPQELCDENVQKFKALNDMLKISNDRFIRTTEHAHKQVAQEMFRRSLEKGDIYFSKYEGWYNPREEAYVTDSNAMKDNYKDPVTGKDYEKHQEQLYLFRMSKYQKQLVEHLKQHKDFIRPENVYNHILKRLEEPLRDLCVSRSKRTLDWGIPLPNDEDHVMYVWFDALTNYLSGIDYFQFQNKRLESFWPCDVHIIGLGFLKKKKKNLY